MLLNVITGILLPFFGTALGSAAVFLMKRNHRAAASDCLYGFAGGVMLAASVWSLLLPAIEKSSELGSWSFLPSALGFFLGIIFMVFSDSFIERSEKQNERTSKSDLVTAFAVTVHNIPEGMAVGLVYATLLSSGDREMLPAAVSLSIGIALQNIPEGAIVSMPLFSGERGRIKAFLSGVLSGAVEPLAALGAILCVSLFSPLMPYFLSFAAGAMIFVVIKELSAELCREKSRGMLFFALGFTVMMSLDVALG